MKTRGAPSGKSSGLSGLICFNGNDFPFSPASVVFFVSISLPSISMWDMAKRVAGLRRFFTEKRTPPSLFLRLPRLKSLLSMLAGMNDIVILTVDGMD